jgi:hypothetical protein
MADRPETTDHSKPSICRERTGMTIPPQESRIIKATTAPIVPMK